MDCCLAVTRSAGIDSLSTNKEKIEYLLDKVIKPGLEIDYTKQFDEILRTMRTSDDPAVNYLIDKIEQSTSTTLLSADQKPEQATSKGSHVHTHSRRHIDAHA